MTETTPAVVETAPAEAPAEKPTPSIPQVESNILAAAKAGEETPASGDNPETKDNPAVKPEEEKKAADKTPLKPEDYKLTVPEGIDAENPTYGAFLAAAAEADLPAEAVQKVLDKVGPEFVKAQIAPYEAWKTMQEKWQAEVQSDPEIGGAKLESTVAGIAKVIDRFGGSDGGVAVRQALETTGAGNNPALIRLFANISKAVNEGTPVRPNGPAAKKTAAEIFYPNQA